MNSLTFSGHETFHCRPLWLKKGYDFVASTNRFSDDSAVIELGVGKNMVTAIRYWLRAFGVTNENDEVQPIGDFLFGQHGKDPYLENISTLWLLHYLLVTRARASIFALVFNEFRKERIEFNKGHLEWFIKRKCEESKCRYNPKTVSNDINVFLKSYLRPRTKTRNIEEDFLGLFIDLHLIQPQARFENGSRPWFKIETREREEIPNEIFLFAILDNEKYGNSISFNELLNGNNSAGMVFGMNASAVMSKIDDLANRFPGVSFSDDAGIRELQFKEKPDKWEVLDQYYYHEN